MYQFDRESYNKRMEWFLHDRFGMFIHWGLYAIPAQGEWMRSLQKIPLEDYEPYFEEFNPVDYDPKAWAKTAKQAGMKYAVLTAKHHDGFCLFDSKLTDYKSTNTPCKRDLVREYLEAFRAEGLKVGLYYSLLDWHHPDYPHFGDEKHPMRENEAFKGVEHNFDNYLDYLHGQVEELCTNYGKIDLFWFDFSYGKMAGETWRGSELVRMIRKYQPHAILDNRLDAGAEGHGSLVTRHPKEYSGDFVSPEQIIPPEGIRDEDGNPVAWESCVTMNNHWGYCENDRFFKPADMVVRKLVECVSKGGNMLINVGPDARGNIPQESLDILEQVGRWMKRNGESVYGCGFTNRPKPDYGRITAKGNKLYYHVCEGVIGAIPLPGISPEQVEKIRLLATGSELHILRNWLTDGYPNYTFALRGTDNKAIDPVLPDPIDTVIEVTLK